MQKEILIITIKNDTHAEAVAWGLKQLGHHTKIWYWEDFPKIDRNSLSVDTLCAPSFAISLNGKYVERPFDSVWVRRRGKVQPQDGAHPDDKEIIDRESAHFIENILPFIGHPGTLWINSPDVDRKCRSKAYQLAVAAEVGLTIPPTLMSNDPVAIRNFYKAHDKRIIFKGFMPAVWDNEDGTRTLMRTSLLTEQNLLSDYALSAAPGIYQPFVEKSFELRVTYIGGKLYAAKIDSQISGLSVDWRFDIKVDEKNFRIFQLPNDWEIICMKYVEKLNLRFGCMDFIVTSSGELIFLEINTIGQFLWKEFTEPKLRLLEAFCHVLAHIPLSTETKVTFGNFWEQRQVEHLLNSVDLVDEKQ